MLGGLYGSRFFFFTFFQWDWFLSLALSKSMSLPLRMPQWQWRFLHSSLLQWKIFLSTLNSPPHTHLLNYFPCEILFPSQSVSLSFSLFPFLLLWVVFICPDSSVPHHQLYEMTAHILGLQQGLFTEKEQHTHSNNPLLPWFVKYHTHPPPSWTWFRDSFALVLRWHCGGMCVTVASFTLGSSDWRSFMCWRNSPSTTATEAFTQPTANNRTFILQIQLKTKIKADDVIRSLTEIYIYFLKLWSNSFQYLDDA